MIDIQKVNVVDTISYGKIYRNTSIDNLLKKSIIIDSLTPYFQGYRIQLFAGIGSDAKDDAFEIRNKFVKLYPNINTYVKYYSPNWKLRIGDFVNYLEAVYFQRIIDSYFPNGFIIQDNLYDN